MVNYDRGIIINCNIYQFISNTKETLIMKYLLLIIGMIGMLYITVYLTHYNDRMKEYNAHVCAVEGYQEDCITSVR